ncbi:MAG: hypothetical protein ABIT20_12650 [Gemmatimonadaceae bacterium]
MSQESPVVQPKLATTPAVPGVTVVTPAAFTKQDIAALRARAEELSNQITSASGRRKQTRDALRTATGADKSGLELRLGVLDARIARLETDIDENGRLLASVRATSVGTTTPSFNPGNRNFDRIANNMIPIVAIFTIFVLAPIALSISRLLWKRGSLRHAAQAPDNTQRLERMEQALDSIAIEMERVSEGQRFVTRIMSESRSVGEVQRAAQPLPIPVGEKAVAPRY